MLDKKIKIKSLPDSESNKDSKDGKYNRVDVLTEENDSTLIMIEIQFTEEIDYFHRMLFGSCKTVVDYFSKGMPYSKVRKVYSINVVYFDLGSGKDYIYHGTTTFKGLHYKDELELTSEQRNEFAKLDIKDIYPEYYIVVPYKYISSVFIRIYSLKGLVFFYHICYICCIKGGRK
ncbi:MAG: PD-(D/E)XK nuclease family transposase [Fibromonadaceae bacterium]|nr:PD-(D/E)XK nuclease family transposase [Fibromonadaceae bacterium]